MLADRSVRMFRVPVCSGSSNHESHGRRRMPRCVRATLCLLEFIAVSYRHVMCRFVCASLATLTLLS